MKFITIAAAIIAMATTTAANSCGTVVTSFWTDSKCTQKYGGRKSQVIDFNKWSYIDKCQENGVTKGVWNNLHCNSHGMVYGRYNDANCRGVNKKLSSTNVWNKCEKWNKLWVKSNNA